MQERLLNQFPNPSTVKYSEISVSFNGTRTNKLGAIRNRWLKTHCGAVDGKNIPLRKQPLKNFIQKFCASYSADKHWEDPHSPIAVEEVPLAVQGALPTMLQVAVWPLGPVKEEVALNLKVEEGQCPRPDSIQPTRRRRAPASSSTTPRSPTSSPAPPATPTTAAPSSPPSTPYSGGASSSPSSPPSSGGAPSSPSTPSPAPSSSGNPRIFPVENALKDFLAANQLEGTSRRERFTHLYNPKGGLRFLFSKPSLFDLFYFLLLGDGSCGVVSLSIALYGTDRYAPVLYQYLRRLFLPQNIF